jgi:hypothetical protein
MNSQSNQVWLTESLAFQEVMLHVKNIGIWHMVSCQKNVKSIIFEDGLNAEACQSIIILLCTVLKLLERDPIRIGWYCMSYRQHSNEGVLQLGLIRRDYGHLHLTPDCFVRFS